MNRGSVALGVVAVLVLAGAEGGGCRADREVPVAVVHAGAQCGGAGEGISARRIASADELRDVLAPKPETELGTAQESSDPAPDFSKEAVVIVSMGARPTAGHSVELARETAPAKGKVAALLVTLRSPEPGAMTAQMITSPCLVVKLAKEGLDELKVVGPDEKVLATVGLK